MLTLLTEYAVPVMLGLSVICLVFSLLGLKTWTDSLKNSDDVKSSYWSKIYAGVAYLALGLDGIVATFFIDERRLLTYVIAWGFFLLGVFMLKSGLRQRKSAIAKS